MVTNDIICGGTSKKDGWEDSDCYYVQEGKGDVLENRCRQSTADAAFMFLTALVMIGIFTAAFRRMRRPY